MANYWQGGVKVTDVSNPSNWQNEYTAVPYSRNNVGVFDSIRQGRETDYKSEQEIALQYASEELAMYLLINTFPHYEGLFRSAADRYGLHTKRLHERLSLRTAQLAFGAPMALAKDNLRQYTVTYYNPTQHTLNVKPLGVLDDDKKPVETVEPGGWIRIPEGYTKGGRYSVIKTNVPQLRPMKAHHGHDGLTDVKPLTYIEWIMYQPNRPSPCCKEQALWSDTGHVVVCQKCKKPIDLSLEA
jgi:hypothetical protein